MHLLSPLQSENILYCHMEGSFRIEVLRTGDLRWIVGMNDFKEHKWLIASFPYLGWFNLWCIKQDDAEVHSKEWFCFWSQTSSFFRESLGGEPFKEFRAKEMSPSEWNALTELHRKYCHLENVACNMHIPRRKLSFIILRLYKNHLMEQKIHSENIL